MQIAASQSGPAGPDSRFFNRVNDYRGVGTRYKKLVANFCHGQTRRRACVAQGAPTTFRANEIYSEPHSIMWARSAPAQHLYGPGAEGRIVGPTQPNRWTACSTSYGWK
jgi:hypothetical protein